MGTIEKKSWVNETSIINGSSGYSIGGRVEE